MNPKLETLSQPTSRDNK